MKNDHASPPLSPEEAGKVFLSYRRRKLPQISALVRRLESLAVPVWFDLRTMTADDWKRTVYERLDTTPAGIVAFTPDCFVGEASDWVEYEAKVLKRRQVYIPCCIEPTELRPPFSRDHARDLSAWFAPYSGHAALPMESGDLTSGPANFIEWEAVLDALGALLGRKSLHQLDMLFDRTAKILFNGDRELAMNRKFVVGNPEKLEAAFDELAELIDDAAAWIAAAPVLDPAVGGVRSLHSQLDVLLKTSPHTDDRRWIDGAFKGRAVSPNSIPGTQFRDATKLPTMTVVPAGRFLIGSAVTEVGRSESEGPQIPVAIEKAFALATTPTTVGQWRKFIETTGYRPTPGVLTWNTTGNCWALSPFSTWQDPGFDQTDDHPVVGVSWHDATAYVRWLSDITVRSYRLPTEAEWEHAGRFGVEGPYPWGHDAPIAYAHFVESPRDLTSGLGTVPVASFSPNALGLRDMSGNVWEWCQDSWVRGYADMSSTGAARLRQHEQRRVARGGGWRSPRSDLRCAARRSFPADERNSHIGFRVASSV